MIGENTPSAATNSTASPWMFFCPVKIERSIIERIGPALIIPTSPKEFSSDCLPPVTFDIPREIAKTKGVVRAPVVAPEASKEIAKNSSATNIASAKIIPYVIVINTFRGLLRSKRKTPKDIITPTPTDTIYTIKVDPKVPPEAFSICDPRISKSGSATVIKNPNKKLKKAILYMDFDVAISLDICSPMEFIDNSTPHKKTDSPIKRSKPPITKRNITSVSTSTTVKQSKSTNNTTGNKVWVTSFVFSKRRFMESPPYVLPIYFQIDRLP